MGIKWIDRLNDIMAEIICKLKLLKIGWGDATIGLNKLCPQPSLQQSQFQSTSHAVLCWYALVPAHAHI